MAVLAHDHGLPAAALALLVLLSVGADRSESASVEVSPREGERRVDVRIDGRPFTAYLWPESLTKPVLYPLTTARGTPVTRGFPLEPRPGERTDHPHHVGLWLSYGDVNGVDFWNNSTARPPEEQARMGRSRQVRIVSAEGGQDEGRLRVAVEWVLPGGVVALDEDTTFVFRGDGRTRTIERSSRLTARGQEVLFKDNKEGFLGLRVARFLEHPSTEPATLTDASGRPTPVPALDNTGVTGRYRSSEGPEGDLVWGTRGRYVALSGRSGEEEVTVAILDHPKNPGAPTYWHARGYGLFAANNLGQAALSNGRDRLDLRLAPGESATFRFKVVILAGPFDRAESEALYRAWTALP